MTVKTDLIKSRPTNIIKRVLKKHTLEVVLEKGNLLSNNLNLSMIWDTRAFLQAFIMFLQLWCPRPNLHRFVILCKLNWDTPLVFDGTVILLNLFLMCAYVHKLLAGFWTSKMNFKKQFSVNFLSKETMLFPVLPTHVRACRNFRVARI